MPSAKPCVRRMLPRMIPLPVRVVVMVSMLLPVFMKPVVMLMVATLTLLSRSARRLPDDLLRVMILKVVAPVIVVLVLPENTMVLEDAVKLPAIIQLPSRLCVNDDALNVVEAAMFRSPFTVMAPAAVLVLPLETVRLP